MTNTYINIDTAKLAWDKNVRITTNPFYDVEKNKRIYRGCGCIHDYKGRFVSCFSQSFLQKILREKYNINVFMTFKPNVKKWDYMVYDMNMNAYEYIKYVSMYRKTYPSRSFNNYEEALETGLQEALNLIKKNE